MAVALLLPIYSQLQNQYFKFLMIFWFFKGHNWKGLFYWLESQVDVYSFLSSKIAISKRNSQNNNVGNRQKVHLPITDTLFFYY